MASTYALPLNPATHTHTHAHAHSHARSSSQYSSDSTAPWPATAMDNVSPPRQNGHDVNAQSHGQNLSPYAHSHSHSHTHSASTESTYALKPFMAGRPKGRSRGDSDLGRPMPRKPAHPAFSPIQETPPQPQSSLTQSWLQLPEALTALLIPLPYIFASLAYPSIVAQTRRLPTSPLDAVADQKVASPEDLRSGGQLLHACTLSSTTLLLVGFIAKIQPALEDSLDRRKPVSTAETPRRGAADALLSVKSLLRLIQNTFGVLLPFYAAMQLGGAKASLVLLAAATAGLGSFDQGPRKHGVIEQLKRTLRTRKSTWSAILFTSIIDTLISTDPVGTLLGYGALVLSLTAVPVPLPTTGWFLMTTTKPQDGWNTQNSSRASPPKPSSPLVDTSINTTLTLVSGIVLTFLSILYSSLTESSPSVSQSSILFSTLSVASATALVFLSLPSALRSKNKAGLAVGSLLTTACGIWDHADSWQSWSFFPLACALVFGAITIDTRHSPSSHSSSHGHAHAGHSHSHSHDHDHDHDHAHHLHGNHSRVSKFLIARCTPGSILHSILIEKDSRRIAYFGVLNLAFMLVQFFYGFVTGSLGLLTDSIHMLFDCAGLAVGLAAAVMSKWRPNARFPYGYGKVDTLSGFANGVFLLLVSVEIIFDAFERLWEGQELNRLNELLIVSILGFVVNIVGLTAFGHAHHGHGHSHDHDHGDHGHSHGHSHDNENMQGIFLHILADALGSVAVIISTLLTKYYGWSGWDPIASCIIAVLIFFSAIPLVKSAGMRLMLSLPADVEYGLRSTLQELSSLRGVIGYAVPKFWLEDEGAAHAEVHAKEHDKCDHGHSHDHSNGHSHGHSHDHSHDHSHNQSHGHSHGHSHGDSHGHSHSDHSHSHSFEHSHEGHSHGHSDHDHSHHDHDHASVQPKILGVIHIIASPIADLEDVRERSTQFLKGRGLDVVVHVEREGEGHCWCGGSGTKTN